VEVSKHKKCLIFAAQHGIAPMIEVIRADKVDEAYEGSGAKIKSL
jgi:uncharacterized zinc-type alcohol dehydrogenase-like protein